MQTYQFCSGSHLSTMSFDQPMQHNVPQALKWSRHNHPALSVSPAEHHSSSETALPKFRPPRLYNPLDRQRLYAHLDATATAPVTWISGPGGSGKTTLAATYFTARGLTACWYRLDCTDLDPASFLTLLRQAFTSWFPADERSLPLFSAEQLMHPERYLSALCQAALPLLPARASLVFDDFHEAETGSLADRLLRDAPCWLPPGCRIIVLSRDVPPASLHAALGDGLAQITYPALRLTSEESDTLATSYGIADQASAHQLLTHTDGWLAGFVLLAHTPAPRLAADEALQPSQAVFDYFADQLLDRLPQALRAQLQALSLAEYITPALLSRLTDASDLPLQLDAWAKRDHFVSQLGNGYLLHPLLRQSLQQEFSQWPADARQAQTRRMGALLAETGQPELALQLLLAGEAHTQAAAMLHRLAPTLFEQGRWPLLAQYIGQLPPERVASHPWLAYWRAITGYMFGPGFAREAMRPVVAEFAAGADCIGETAAQAEVVASYVYEWENSVDSEADSERLLALLHEHWAHLPVEVAARASACAIDLLFNRDLNHPALPLLVARCQPLLASTLAPRLRVQLGCALAYYWGWQGLAAPYREVCDSVRDIVATTALPPFESIWWQMVQLFHARLTPGFDGRQAHEEARALIARHGLGFLSLPLATAALHLYTLPRWQAGLPSLLDELASHCDSSRLLDMLILDCMRGWHALTLDKVELAAGRLAQAEARQAGCRIAISNWLASELTLQLAAATGDRAHARRIVAAAAARPGHRANPWLAMAEDWLLALTDWQAGDHAAALARLRPAMAVAARENYPPPPLSQPRQLARLCAICLEHDIEPDYVRRLIHDAAIAPPDPDTAAWPWPVKIVTLGRFALQLEGKPPRRGKPAAKSLELLQALLATGGRGVHVQHLVDHLWPEAEGDAGVKAFHTTLHRLRNLLQDETALQLEDNKLTLNRERCWVDAWAFERSTDRLLAPAGAVPAAMVLPGYPGDFLPEQRDKPWSVALRDRLRSRYLQAAIGLGEACLAQQRPEQAAIAFARALDGDSLSEHAYLGLIRAQLAQGQREAALDAYRQCRQQLSVQLGITPGEEIQALYQQLLDTLPHAE